LASWMPLMRTSLPISLKSYLPSWWKWRRSRAHWSGGCFSRIWFLWQWGFIACTVSIWSARGWWWHRIVILLVFWYLPLRVRSRAGAGCGTWWNFFYRLRWRSGGWWIWGWFKWGNAPVRIFIWVRPLLIQESLFSSPICVQACSYAQRTIIISLFTIHPAYYHLPHTFW
jgi:hypothetical protein